RRPRARERRGGGNADADRRLGQPAQRLSLRTQRVHADRGHGQHAAVRARGDPPAGCRRAAAPISEPSMTRRLFASAAALCLVAGLPAPAASAPADEDARAWLLRIHRATQELDYEGTFVYRQGGQLETMRIVHRADDGRVRERLIALTGPPREVIRTDDEVRCYLPDQQSVFIEQRRLDRKAFLSIVPERLPEVEQNYAMQLGDVGRIAGRSAQQLLIRARDDYRYGYRLWADRETGLLLKADLMSDRGRVLEQFMFTQIRLGGPIPDEALEPRTPMTGLIRYDDTRVAGEGPSRSWRAAQPPKGFRLTGVVV